MADYIRREDALFALRKAERGGSMTALTRLERAYAEIREMPAADVAEVVHGTPVTEVRTRTIVGYHLLTIISSHFQYYRERLDY